MTRKTKKQKGKTFIFKILLALAITLVGMYYVVQLFFPPTFIKYKGFGISLPGRYSIHGIDISRYQQNINWEQVKSMEDEGINLQFAFIKATEGVFYIDPYYRRNWVKARDAGIPRGAYHFFTANKSGEKQAKNFVATVTLLPGDLPPVLDVEKSYGRSKKEIQEEVLVWLKIVEEKYHVKPIIYTNPSFYKSYLAGIADDYPLWIAHYFAPNKPRIERDWVFWQHTERGRVNGIKSLVDFNVFNGSYSDFENLKIQGDE